MIDVERLPNRPLIDTTVFIAAWGKLDDPAHDDSESFLKAMEDAGRVMLVATPTIAELLRGDDQIGLPHRRSFVPVPFDVRAAEILGRDMKKTVLQKARDESGRSYQYIKYDAMIVACAKLYEAPCIVTTDERHMPNLAAQLKVACVTPGAFKLPLFRARKKT